MHPRRRHAERPLRPDRPPDVPSGFLYQGQHNYRQRERRGPAARDRRQVLLAPREPRDDERRRGEDRRRKPDRRHVPTPCA